MSHTPTPWDFYDEEGNDNFARSIYGPAREYDALVIARVDQNGTKDDAAFIVRAVNAYDELVETLAQAKLAVDELCIGQDEANECWNIARKVNAALAKAGAL